MRKIIALLIMAMLISLVGCTNVGRGAPDTTLTGTNPDPSKNQCNIQVPKAEQACLDKDGEKLSEDASCKVQGKTEKEIPCSYNGNCITGKPDTDPPTTEETFYCYVKDVTYVPGE